ncbi:hypothetical protein L1887_34688 [Cichorium endivia]|nr:hypothetical protein L1887_34688 [Cichorium endivia]
MERPWGRFIAESRDSLKKVLVWLGTFYSAEDAARAYDVPAQSLHGAKAKMNFPLTIPSTPQNQQNPNTYHPFFDYRPRPPPTVDVVLPRVQHPRKQTEATYSCCHYCDSSSSVVVDEE